MMTFKMPEPSNPSDPSGQAQDVWWPRPFQLELLPTDRRDAVQAVLYRVGDPLHLMDPEVALTAALREARTERTLPLQKTRRRRWVAAAPVEEPADVAREPHERPALVAVAGLSRLRPGTPLSGKRSMRRPGRPGTCQPRQAAGRWRRSCWSMRAHRNCLPI